MNLSEARSRLGSTESMDGASGMMAGVASNEQNSNMMMVTDDSSEAPRARTSSNTSIDPAAPRTRTSSAASTGSDNLRSMLLPEKENSGMQSVTERNNNSGNDGLSTNQKQDAGAHLTPTVLEKTEENDEGKEGEEKQDAVMSPQRNSATSSASVTEATNSTARRNRSHQDQRTSTRQQSVHASSQHQRGRPQQQRSQTSQSYKTSASTTEIVRSMFGSSIGQCWGDFSCQHNHIRGRLYACSEAVLYYSILFGFEKKICLRYETVEQMQLYRSTSIEICVRDPNYTDDDDVIRYVFKQVSEREQTLQLLIELWQRSQGAENIVPGSGGADDELLPVSQSELAMSPTRSMSPSGRYDLDELEDKSVISNNNPPSILRTPKVPTTMPVSMTAPRQLFPEQPPPSVISRRVSKSLPPVHRRRPRERAKSDGEVVANATMSSDNLSSTDDVSDDNDGTSYDQVVIDNYDEAIAQYSNRKCCYADGTPAHVPSGECIAIVPSNYIQNCGGKQSKAEKMWKETLKWREENEVWKVHTKPSKFFHDIKKAYPHAAHGHSKDGFPVLYELTGKMQLKGLFGGECTIDDMIHHYIFSQEFVSNYLCADEQLRLLRGESTTSSYKAENFGVFVVMDIKGAGISLLSGDILRYLRKAGDIAANHYPMAVKNVIVINVPYFASGAYKIIRSVLPESVNIELFSEAKSKEGLQKYIDVDQIPKEFGGTSSYAFGQHPYELKLIDLIEKPITEAISGAPPERALPPSSGPSKIETAAWETVKISGDPCMKEVGIEPTTLPVSLETFFRMFLADNAPYSVEHYQTSDLIRDLDFQMSPWKPSRGGILTRKLEFRHPVSAALSVGPSHAPTQKKQRLQQIPGCGISLTSSTTIEEMPASDCFSVEDQWLIEASGKSQVTVSAKFGAKFHKRSLLKSIIAKNVKSGNKEWFDGYKQMIQSSVQEHLKASGAAAAKPPKPDPIAVREDTAEGAHKVPFPGTSRLLVFVFIISQVCLVVCLLVIMGKSQKSQQTIETLVEEITLLRVEHSKVLQLLLEERDRA